MNAHDPAYLYFHGLPGGTGELGAFATTTSGGLVAIDRLSAIGAQGGYEAGLEQVAREIAASYPGRPLHLIGFSLGAMTALRLAPLLGQQVAKIELISAAAPLELGDFLPDMAGKPVFMAAQNGGWRFAALCRVQALAARSAGGLFYRGLLAGVTGPEKTLCASAQFQAVLRQNFASCLNEHSAAYRLELQAYTGPWAHLLAELQAPVRLWHGEADGWAPLAMVRALQAALPGGADMRLLPDLAHYSMLAAALAVIVKDGAPGP
ncbi:MAG: alpha/beta hydrolase [Rhodobacteraceae bacterium]|nr:alpha/beta hydrolase [Paracoccaceae bacterium]